MIVNETAGLTRANEPVTVGVPIARGVLANTNGLRLVNPSGRCVPVQLKPLAYWPDGTIKWLLIDAAMHIDASASDPWFLVEDNAVPEPQVPDPLTVSKNDATITIENTSKRFICSTRVFLPFAGVAVDNCEITASELTMTMLEDSHENLLTPHILSTDVETEGPLRTTICQKGKFRFDSKISPIDFIARLSFYAMSNRVSLAMTIRNTNAAQHPGNLWDLGDEGSFLFRELSITLGIRPECAMSRSYTDQSTRDEIASNIHRLLIYQDSSGGVHWDSPAHVDSNGESALSFQGYRISTDGQPVRRGNRIDPAINMSGPEGSVSVAIEKFWQQFPSGLGFDDSCITIELFPRHTKMLHELQGGEQKTHTINFLFGSKADSDEAVRSLNHPLVVHSTPAWYCKSGVFSSVAPMPTKKLDRCEKLIMGAVAGKSTFFDRRELVDEYGWRHFGDLYADHEAVGHKGTDKLISHYNNQYDVIYGAQKQFARTGDIRWLRLIGDLARHVIDIDIYHTSKDRKEYNHGLFWHTDHYTHASTCTHRTYSKNNMIAKGLASYGGGPSPSHNYPTGIMNYYYMTGDMMARESFLEMMQWTAALMRGPKSPKGKAKLVIKNMLRSLKELKAGEPIEPYELNGPGRASGNVLSALLDGWVFTGDNSFMSLAEKLIRRCISPTENIAKRKLFCTEMRWMYLVFLLALIKYMHMKEDNDLRDNMYHYARKSLLNYARYMADNEYRFLSKPEKLEYPNETWGAQDMRKCAVFHYASKYAKTGAEQKRFEQRAESFYQSSIDDIWSFRTRTLTRPIVLLMMYGHIHPYFMTHKD